MKLRTLFLFGAGVVAGLMLARKLSEDDPEVVHGPTRGSAGNPTVRVIGTQASRLADRATVLSLDTIRKARGRIRERLGEDVYDDAVWT
jgi:hypothetical protein